MEQTEQQQKGHELSDFFRASPLVGSDTNLSRDRTSWRANPFLPDDDSDAMDERSDSPEPP